MIERHPYPERGARGGGQLGQATWGERTRHDRAEFGRDLGQQPPGRDLNPAPFVDDYQAAAPGLAVLQQSAGGRLEPAEPGPGGHPVVRGGQCPARGGHQVGGLLVKVG